MANIRPSRATGCVKTVSDSFFRYSRGSRNPVQIERGTRTLQRLAAYACLKRSAKRALHILDSCFRRNGRMGMLDSCFRRNGGVGALDSCLRGNPVNNARASRSFAMPKSQE